MKYDCYSVVHFSLLTPHKQILGYIITFIKCVLPPIPPNPISLMYDSAVLKPSPMKLR